MKYLNILLIATTMLLVSCGGNESNGEDYDGPPPKSMIEKKDPADAGKGIGEIKEVDLNTPLKPDMVDKGKAIYDMKCSACHKLTDTRVVGPGWARITDRRKPEWIMNMITNVEVMLKEDPIAQEQLKECLVRMPNQNLSIGDARDVLEYMYANDGETVGSE